MGGGKSRLNPSKQCARLRGWWGSSRQAPDTPADEPQIPILAKLHPTSPPEADFLTIIDLDITTHIPPGLSTVPKP